MGNVNRKATSDEMDRLRRVVREAYPGCSAVVAGHGAYGGHRAPRDHTISFRVRDERGRYRSNVVWVMPDQIAALTAEDVRALVDSSNGR